MNILTELYIKSQERLPQKGQFILGHQSNELIVVYQAYKNCIADYAVKEQYFGGSDFSYNRMSWIKTSFLWMMYRSGWAEKENQERILAIWLNKKDFEEILKHSILTSFDQKYYGNYNQWKKELNQKEVRIQWDPDHDPFGNKIERRAIQIGLKGSILKEFGQNQIKKIDDITSFVKQQKELIKKNQIDKLLIPTETIYKTSDNYLNEKIGIE